MSLSHQKLSQKNGGRQREELRVCHAKGGRRRCARSGCVPCRSGGRTQDTMHRARWSSGRCSPGDDSPSSAPVLALSQRAGVSRWAACYSTLLSHDATRADTVAIDGPSCFGQLRLTHRDCVRAGKWVHTRQEVAQSEGSVVRRQG
jgi:hypothetical protein